MHCIGYQPVIINKEVTQKANNIYHVKKKKKKQQ